MKNVKGYEIDKKEMYGKSEYYTHVAPVSMVKGMLRKDTRRALKKILKETTLDLSKNVYVVDNPNIYCGKCGKNFEPFDLAYIIFFRKTFQTVNCLECSPLENDPKKVRYYKP